MRTRQKSIWRSTLERTMRTTRRSTSPTRPELPPIPTCPTVVPIGDRTNLSCQIFFIILCGGNYGVHRAIAPSWNLLQFCGSWLKSKCLGAAKCVKNKYQKATVKWRHFGSSLLLLRITVTNGINSGVRKRRTRVSLKKRSSRWTSFYKEYKR